MCLLQAGGKYKEILPSASEGDLDGRVLVRRGGNRAQNVIGVLVGKTRLLPHLLVIKDDKGR